MWRPTRCAPITGADRGLGGSLALLAAPEAWAGTLPAVLAVPVSGEAERRAFLRRLAAVVLGCSPEGVSIRHAAGRAPRLVRPEGAGLVLSSASRHGVAALAVARGAIGVDIEAIEDREPPWNVLHLAETRELRALPADERPAAFARMWSAREAYLKATGTGLAREPESVAVTVTGPGLASVRDGEYRATARLAPFRLRGAGYVVALVVLGA